MSNKKLCCSKRTNNDGQVQGAIEYSDAPTPELLSNPVTAGDISQILSANIKEVFKMFEGDKESEFKAFNQLFEKLQKKKVTQRDYEAQGEKFITASLLTYLDTFD